MTGGVESLGRIRLQGILLLAATFLAGGAAGVAGGRIWGAQRAGEVPPPPPRLRPVGPPPAYERLGLSDDQRARITAILERTRPRTDSVMREVMPRLRAITDSAEAEINTVLTAEQRERFERDRARFGPGGGRFGGPVGDGLVPPGGRARGRGGRGRGRPPGG
jgi:Spy/CpxP family protein refolding chaperone